MAAKTIEIEVGFYSLVHTDMLGTLGKEQNLIARQPVLLVLNDPEDVYYEIHTTASGIERVFPKIRHENCVIAAIGPGIPESRLASIGPSRLFCHAAHGVQWPALMFRAPGALGETGPFDTALAVLAESYSWTNDADAGAMKTTVSLPDGSRTFKITRGVPTDLVSEIHAGKSIEKIVLKSTGGVQPGCCPSGWPP